MIKGIPVSEGYAIGKVLRIEDLKIDYRKKYVMDPKEEIKSLRQAIEQSINQLKSLKTEVLTRLDEETSKIFDAHMMIAKDPELISSIERIIIEESCNLTYAVKMVVDHYTELFEQIHDDYLRERAKDLLDVSKRIIRNATRLPIVDYATIHEYVIIVAKDITPSETAQMNPKYILGFVTEEGGKTSHSAIIARLLGIPAVAGAKDILMQIKNDQDIILDAKKGEVILTYDQKIKNDYVNLIDLYQIDKQKLNLFLGKTSETKDHKQIKLAANIVSSRDLNHVIEADADGIGLFRTEFLFLEKIVAPSEEDQFNEYKKVLEKMNPKPVVIRTLDIGGDKKVPYIHIEHEDNPFLGKRAIRLCFDEIEIFKTQLRAIVRASYYGHLKLMFPMIATKDEFLKAKQIVLDIMDEFDQKNILYKKFDIGMMVEIPSAALAAHHLADVVDFFSIGTNDLIQYTFAADRMKESLEYLYQPLNPVILNMIKHVVDAAHKKNKWITVCGEMASDGLAGPLLIGLGVNELSMTPTAVLKMRSIISKYTYDDLRKLAMSSLEKENEKQVISLIKEYL